MICGGEFQYALPQLRLIDVYLSALTTVCCKDTSFRCHFDHVFNELVPQMNHCGTSDCLEQILLLSNGMVENVGVPLCMSLAASKMVKSSYGKIIIPSVVAATFYINFFFQNCVKTVSNYMNLEVNLLLYQDDDGWVLAIDTERPKVLVHHFLVCFLYYSVSSVSFSVV